MLGQWRKCRFCNKRFRLSGTRGIIRTSYNYITLVNKFSGGYEYSHKKCFELFRRTKPQRYETEIKGGFELKKGLFVEGSIKEKDYF